MKPLAGLPSRASSLRLLVLSVSQRCDQRCVHCQIWKGPPLGAQPLRREERLALAEEAIGLGVEEVLLTGGEPLLSPDLFPLAERFRAAGVRVLLATNGLLLAQHAERVAGLFAEVYVSLDGACAESHDALRGVPSFRRLADGVAGLRAREPRPLLVARATLHARNLHEAAGIVAAARGLGFDHVSFLGIDTSSAAFGGRPEERAALVPRADQLLGFTRWIDGLVADDGFLLETPAKLRRIAAQLRAAAGGAAATRPDCDAPWWSSVVEADGSLRPCFFHAPVADARDGLAAVRGSAGYRSALARVRGDNPVCERCVCAKRRGVPWRDRLLA